MVAEMFLKAMQQAGVPNADPNNLNWAEIIAQDTLLQAPPALWDDIVMAAENHPLLWNLIFNAIS